MSYGRITGVIFLLVAAAHGYRAAMAVPVMVGTYNVPIWMSGAGAVIAAIFGLWGLTKK